MNLSRYRGIASILPASVVLTLVMLTLALQPTHAAGPWYVAPGGKDTDDCLSPATACASINGAIAKATPGWILVATGVYTGSGTEVVRMDKSVALLGGWDATFTTHSGTSTIDGQSSRCGILVAPDVAARVENFRIENGSLGNCGGIAVMTRGDLVLYNSIVSGNSETRVGDGIYIGGGGIYNDGTVILSNSTVSGNSGYAGGIRNQGTMTLNNVLVYDNTTHPTSDGAGGILNTGTMTLNDSAVSRNTSATGYGGIHNHDGAMSLNNSTVSYNAGTLGAGGIENSGSRGTLSLNNSTVSGNTALSDGGGIRTWHGTLNLNSSTISGNTASQGGGIFNYMSLVTLENTIVAGNSAVGGPDCSGSIGSAGHNLLGDTSGCDWAPGPGDLSDVVPRLGPMEGSPAYHPLLAGSPAINAGNPTGCRDHLGNLLLTDQRGKPRAGRCDIGAYEVMPLNSSGKTASISAALHGDPLTYTITLSNVETVNVTNVLVTDILPPSLSYIGDSLTSTSGSYGYANGVITWTGSVNAGEVVTTSFVATVSLSVGTVTNSAVISGGGEVITRTAIVHVGHRIYLPIVMRSGG